MFYSTLKALHIKAFSLNLFFLVTINLLLFQDMYNAVRNGEFKLLQDLLDKKNADINMLWVRVIYNTPQTVLKTVNFAKINVTILTP